MKWFTCMLSVGVVAAAAAAQDRVGILDGSGVEGRIERIDAGGVVVRPAGAAAPRRIPFPELGPEGATTAGPLAVALANGDRITGRIEGAGAGGVRIASPALGSVLVPVEALEPAPPEPSAKPGGAGAAADPDAELEVFKPAEWKGRIGLSGALRTGNIDSSLFRLDGSIEKLWRVDRFKAAGEATYGETSGITTVNAAKAGAKFDHFWSKPFYSYALAEAGYDEIANVDLRALAGAGAGYEFWHEAADENFGVEAGLNALYESFESGDSRIAPAARGAVFFRDVWFEKLKFEQLGEILVPLDEPSRYLIRATSTMTVPIAEHWNLRNVFEVSYQGEPPPDTESLDLKLLLGIEYTF